MSEKAEKPERKRKTKSVLPLETLADAWAMAQVHGYPKAGKVYDVHPETIRRAGVKIAADETLRARVEQKKQEHAEEWRPQAMQVLRAGMTALEKLFAEAKVDQLRDVAGAVHLLAEKIIAVDAIPNVRRNLPTTHQGQKASTPGPGGFGRAVGERKPSDGAGAPNGNGTGPGAAVPTGNA